MLYLISLLCGVVLFYAFLYFPSMSSAVLLSSSVYLVTRKKFALCLLVVAGAAYAFARYTPPEYIHYTKDPLEIDGVATSGPERTSGVSLKQSFLVETVHNVAGPEIQEGYSAEGIRSLKGKKIVLLTDSGLEIGREYALTVTLMGSGERMNPGEAGRESIYGKIKEVRSKGTKRRTPDLLVEESRYRVQKYFEEHFPNDSAAFLTSVTVGRGAPLDRGLRDAFNTTGLTHILSISGTHFGLLSVLWFGIFRLIIKALPYRILQRFTIYLTPSQAAALLCLPIMVVYLLLSGASIPAVRSFLMIGLFLLGLLIGRRGFWLNSLLFAATLIVIWEPEAILSLSFQLSFLAVFFIGLSIRKNADEKEKVNAAAGYLRSAFLMSLAASAGTAPLVAYHFHYLSVISPVSNLIAGTLIGFILIPIAVVAALSYLFTGYFPVPQFISVIAKYSMLLVELLARIPFADIRIPAFPPIVALLFYAGLIAYVLCGRKRILLLVPLAPAVIFVIVSFFQKDEFAATFLDVGQGDASVVDLPDGRSMVVDTGTTGREVAAFLRYKGKRCIDVLALSHAHPDHTGGLDALHEQFNVKEIWDSGRLLLPDRVKHIRHRSLSRGDVIEGTGYSITALHPYAGFYTASGRGFDAANNDSLVLRIESGRHSFLYAGDIETEAEDDIWHLGRWLKSGVLKVPHHGGKTSSHELFLREVSPDFVVISAGRYNSFGHPHQETLDSLKEISTYRTDLDGAIKIYPGSRGLTVKTYKDFTLKMAASFSDELENVGKLFSIW